MNRKTITAIIPVYNVEEYIEECIDSLLEQEMAFDEIIIINDGSTDKSGEIIEHICEKHPEVKYIVQENQGQAVARNIGIKIAISDYIVFVDSDDYVKCDMVSVLKKMLNNQDVVLYSADIVKNMDISTDGSVYVRDDEVCGIQMSGWEFFKKTYGKKWTVSPCLAAYSTKFLMENKIYFPDGLFYEDNFFFIQVLNCAKKLEVINNHLYVRRYRENSTTTSIQDERKVIDVIKVYIMICNYLKEVYITSIARKEIIRYVCSFCLWQIKKNYNEKNTNITECLARLCIDFIDFISIKKDKLSLSELIVCAYMSDYYTNECGLENNYLKIYRELLKKKVIEILSPINLSESSKKIGIYGTGKHTKELIYLYNKYINDIKANIVYIVSSDSNIDNKEYMPLIEVNKVTNDFDQIVISSKVYQKQMERNLMSVNYGNKIIKFYDENEFFDLTEINDIL